MPIDIAGLKNDPEFKKLSPDEQNALLKRAMAEAGAPVSSTLGTQIGKFGQAAAEAIIRPAGSVVGRMLGDELGGERAVAGFRNAVGAPTEPSLGGSGSEPVDPTKSFGGKVGQVVGETAPFIAGGLGAAKAATAIGRAVGLIGEGQAPALLTALGGAKNSAGRTLVREGRTAVQAGVGAAVAQELAPDSKVAEVAGMLTAALGPEAARRAVNKLMATIPAGYVSPVTRESAQTQVGGMLAKAIPEGSTAEAGLNRAVQIQEETGIPSSVAQATQSPGVRSMERSASNQFPSIATQSQDAQASASEAVRGRIGAMPEVAGAQVPVAQEAVGRGLAAETAAAQAPVAEAQAGRDAAFAQFRQVATDAETKMQAAVAQADQRVEQAAASLRPTSSAEEIGETISRDVIEPAKKAMKAEVDKVYALVDPENTVVLPTDRVAQAIKAAKGEQESALMGAIPELDRLAAQVESQTAAPFNTIRRWASALGDAADNALSGVNPDRRAARILRGASEAVQETLDEAVQAGAPDVVQKYNTAKALYSEYADKYMSGTVAKVLQRGTAGEATKVAAEDIGKQFFRAGSANESVRSLSQYFNAVGADPAAKQAIRDVALNDFFEHAFRSADGTMDAKAAMNWMRSHRAQLGELAGAGVDIQPELTALVQKGRSVEGLRTAAAQMQKRLDAGYLPEGNSPVAAAKQYLDLAEQAAARTVTQIEKSAASKFVGADTERAGATLLRGDSPTRDVEAVMRAAAGDSAAQRGIRRALLDQALAESDSKLVLATGNPLFDPSKFDGFLNRHAGPLRAAFGDAGYANLKRESEIAKTVINPQTSSTSARALEGGSEPVYTQQMLLGRAYQGAKGFAAKTYLVGEAVARTVARVMNNFSNAELRDIYEQSLFNPKVAAELRTLSLRGTPPEEKIRRLRSYLGPAAVKVGEASSAVAPASPE